MRVKTTMLSWLFGLVLGLFLVTGLSQTAFAQDPPGSTCENPLVVDPVATPLVDFAINSEAYGNDYTSAMIVPTSSYLNGYDIVFQFTLTGTSFINASIAGSWTGLIFVGTCPNLATPAPRLAFGGGASGATVPQFSLEAGTYFMIAGTYPAPDFTDMVINFSATAIQEQPNLVVNPATLDVGMAVPGLDFVSKSLTVANQGLSDAVISESDFVFSGSNSGDFTVSLSEGDTYPLTIPFGTSKIIKVNYNPAATGASTANLAVNYNSTNSPANVSLTGTGYLPYEEFSQNFDEVTTIPVGWLPGGWSGIVQSTAPLAVVDVRNIGAPPSLPNHVRLFNSTVTSSVLTLVSPAAVNLSNSWVSFKAKMSSAAHTGNVQVGYLTNRTDPSTFVAVGTIPVTGTYTLYSVSFLSSGLTFPETAYIGFRFTHELASRTLYIDDIVYEVEPVLPIFTANKNEVNFGPSVWVNETALNTLQISNTGVGTITINQSDVTITGADAASFNINYSGTQTWPITLTTGQTFTFNLAFSPTEVRAYTASLNIQDNIPGKALNTFPLLGSGYDATIQPGFLFDFVGTFPPLDWRRFKGLFGTEPVLPTTDAIWVHDQFGNNPDLVDPNSAKINLYGTTRRHWLMSPPINLGDGSQGYQLEFDLALTFWNATTPVTLAPEQKFAVVISTDGGLTWSMDNVLQWWNETTPISNTGDHIVLDLSAYSGRVMLGFYGEMTVSTAGTIDYDLFVRNVAVNSLPADPLLFAENFDYTLGSLLTDNGYTAHSGAGTNPIDVTNGLDFAGYIGSAIGGAANLDNTGEDVHHLFEPQSTGNVYAAFVVKTEPTNSAGYFFHFGIEPWATTYFSRVWVNATGDGIGIGTSVEAYAPITVGEPTLVVVKYNMETKESSLFVFNTFPTEEPATPFATFIETSTAIVNVGGLGLRQYNAAQKVIVDGIRVATTWEDAVMAGGVTPLPVIAVTPESLTESLEIGESSTQMVTVSNTGNAPLDFSIEVVLPNKGASKADISTSETAGSTGISVINTEMYGSLVETHQSNALYSRNLTEDLLWGANWEDPQTTTQGIISTYYGGLNAATMSSDDFTVPAGEQWVISKLSARGFLSTGVPTPEGFAYSIFADNNGQPGDLIDQGVVLGTFDPTLVELNLSTPLTLSSGNYWLGIYAHYETASALSQGRWNQYMWNPTTTPGNPAMLNDFANLFGVAANGWQTLGALGISFSSLDFAIFGTVEQGTNEWLTATPLMGSLAAGETLDIAVGISAADLAAGSYQGSLVFSSNDPVNPTVTVPVSLTVTDPVGSDFPAPRNLTVTDAVFAAQLSWQAPDLGGGTTEDFVEDFEAGTLPTGWVTYDVDGDNYNWDNTAVEFSVFEAHTGLYCMTSASYRNDVGALTPNNWLVTPAIAVTANSELSFWVSAQDPAWSQEQYYVKVSTTGNAVADFTNTVHSAISPAAWAEVIVDLSSFAGQTIYIAFQHANVTDMFFIKIDDVTVSNTVTKAAYTAPVAAGPAEGISFRTSGMSQGDIDSKLNPTYTFGSGEASEYTTAGGEALLIPEGIKHMSGSRSRTLLFDNGPFINSPGTGPNGSDESVLQNSTLGMTTLGPSINYATAALPIRVADDFEVTETWTIDAFTFYAYQTSAAHPTPPVSTITSGRLQIWNGVPGAAGSEVVWGNMETNAMASTSWTNSYRVSQTTINAQRPIMQVVCATPELVLEPGNYWVEWSMTGSIASGPWGVPVTINGELNTGNAMQITSTTNAWTPLLDGGSLTPYGLSFLVEGSTGGSGGDCTHGPLLGYNVYRDGVEIGNTVANVRTYIDNNVTSGSYVYGVSAVYGEPYPGESEIVTIDVTVTVPVITVTPAQLYHYFFTSGDAAIRQLTLGNTGNGPLNWTATIEYVDGSGWLSFATPSGTIAPGATQIRNVSFNSTGLPIGVYNANIRIASNDPATPVKIVPVIMDIAVGVDENPMSAITVYPVPARSELNINLVEGVKTVRMFNFMGQVVMESSINGESTKTFSLDGLRSGAYTLQFINAEGRTFNKTIVVTK